MALGRLGIDKIGRQISVVYCDNCVAEWFYPMLHTTLYRMGKTSIYLCELHAIFEKRRVETPGFSVALNAARKKSEEMHRACVAATFKALADGRNK
jgi:hypothetical protein